MKRISLFALLLITLIACSKTEVEPSNSQKVAGQYSSSVLSLKNSQEVYLLPGAAKEYFLNATITKIDNENVLLSISGIMPVPTPNLNGTFKVAPDGNTLKLINQTTIADFTITGSEMVIKFETQTNGATDYATVDFNRD